MIESSSAAFLDTANFDCIQISSSHPTWSPRLGFMLGLYGLTFHVVIRCSLPTGVIGFKIQLSSVCSLTYSNQTCTRPLKRQ